MKHSLVILNILETSTEQLPLHVFTYVSQHLNPSHLSDQNLEYFLPGSFSIILSQNAYKSVMKYLYKFNPD